MIKNIIFDVGKVLVEYEPEEYMKRLGFDSKQRAAVNEAMFEHALWEESDRGALSIEELLRGFIQNNPRYEAEITRAYMNVGDTVTMMPYSLSWIKSLKERGYRLYILSNYAELTYEQTKEKMLFLNEMNGEVFSFQCKFIKPEAEIYEYLCDKYSLVPQESVFLDDRLENIKQAEMMGIHGIQFKNYEEAAKELEELLENII